MGFELGQKLIDTIRRKQTFKLISHEDCSFEMKIKVLLKNCASYHYPETKNDYNPDFTKPVTLETNQKLIKYDYNKALKELNRLNIQALEETYQMLSDEYSKEIMLKIIAYNCFEEPRLRFPVFYLPYLQMNDIINDCVINSESINLWNGIINLKKHNLSKLGYNVSLFLNTGGIAIDFIQEQYAYKNIVKAEKADIVLDCGACYGDTALYFSEKTNGANVYSFEFLPENVEIFNKNIDLNPQYKNNIKLIQRPVSETSGEKLYAVPNGPGTSITSYKSEGAVELETISIDDFVQQNNIEKIDFIKMDIEGSEEAALKGAIKTIRKYKPKLAVCAYHKKDDLTVLPALIKEILPEYKLYLDHYTMNFTETVLYAKV